MSLELKLSRIGNSRGIRLPAALLKRYQIEDVIIVETCADSLVLRPKRSKKLTWKETAESMAKEKENWDDLDVTLSDGLDSL